MVLTDAHQQLVDRVVAEVSALPGVEAIALGGSLASGTGTADSDIDLGIYYHDSAPFSIDQLRAVANRLNDSPDPYASRFRRLGSLGQRRSLADHWRPAAGFSLSQSGSFATGDRRLPGRAL